MSLPNPSEFSARFELVYTCALETLPASLVAAWHPLQADRGTEQFIEQAIERRQGRLRYMVASVLRAFMSDFDVNGLLGLYPMHLLSEGQARQLLQGAETASLLDVGAGNGNVTACVAKLFEQVQTTEHSASMVRVLRRAGYPCEQVPIGDPLPEDRDALQRRFDVVTVFNVLDRTSHPARLLRRAAARVSDSGVLLVSVPLPLAPFYYDGARTLDPIQPIALSGAEWEEQCAGLVSWCAEHLPEFTLWRLSRCPYISGGDPGGHLYVLDAALLALRPTGAAANV